MQHRCTFAIALVLLGCGEVQMKKAVDAAEGTGSELVSTGDALAIDGTVVVDAAPDAASCSYRCQAPDGVNGPIVGTAGCANPRHACNMPFDHLETVDFCNCSVGSPPLFAVRKSPTAVNLVLVSPPLGAGTSFSTFVEGIGCYSINLACTTTCGNSMLYMNEVSPLPSGSTHTVVVHANDECSSSRYAYTLQL